MTSATEAGTQPVIPVMKPWLGDEEAAAAAATVASGWVVQGPQVAEFERAFAARVRAAHAVAVSSCTTGLHLALHALDVGPGDDVVVPSLSFIATANAPRYLGAAPVFADVDAATQNLTVETIAAAATSATKAVIVVHQVGMPADVAPIRGWCAERGIALVEDAACAIGSTYRGAPVGGGGPLAVFSFHPRKLLTTGEGGMITTPDAGLAERIGRLRTHGMSVSAFDRHGASQLVIEEYLETGYNFRMTDIQAAIGLVQLGKLDAMIDRRRRLADRYREMLGDVPGLELPADPPYGTTNYQSYSVTLTDEYPLSRNDLLQRMMDAGISPRRGVMAAHLEPAFAGHGHGPLPVTEYLTERTVILPLYHDLSTDDQARVVAVVADG